MGEREWEAIKKVATSRRDEYERKMGYCGALFDNAMDWYRRLFREFPEYQEETKTTLKVNFRAFEKWLEEERLSKKAQPIEDRSKDILRRAGYGV